MTLSPFPGFFGPQAVITVVRGDVVSVETKKKAASEENCPIGSYVADFILFFYSLYMPF
jgi:hypothetical protein